MSYLEQILSRKTSKLQKKTDFDLQTNYESEAIKDAKQIYEKHKIFNSKSIEETKVAPVVISHLSKKIKKAEEAQTTGDKWFNMKKNVMTPELTNELNVLKLRGNINPNQFYKNSDWKGLPTYFQIGTVINGGDEPKSMRLPKKERKGNLIDQFLDEDKQANWSKNKFSEIQQKKKNITKRRLDKFKKLKRKGVIRA